MINQTLLKSFTAGFIPLIIFILVDAVYGTEIGLIAAMAIGIAEFLYYYVRYGNIERFILFDLGLILCLGIVSIVLQNALFFKLKPAFIELILAVLLAIHAFSDKPLLLKLGQRYLKNMEFDPVQMQVIRRMASWLLWIVLIHAGLIVYAAFFLSDELWAFISGGLFYIIFGVFFVVQFLYLKFRKIRKPATADSNDEQFDLVTPQGQIIGRTSRHAVHGNPKLLHPVIHVHVFNRNGQIFLQKRSKDKDVQPGKWDTAIGGHVNSGEQIDDAVRREAREELGLRSISVIPLFRYVMRNNFESELVHSYRTTHNGPFRINRTEIDYGRFWKISEVEKNLGKGIFTPNFEHEFQLLKQHVLTKKSKRT